MSDLVLCIIFLACCRCVSTTGAAMSDLVLCIIFLACCRCVSTSDDSDGAGCSSCNDFIHEALGTYLKLRHFKYSHRAVPNNGPGLLHRSSIQCNGLRTTIKSHEAIRDAISLIGRHDFTILTEFGADDKVDGQDNLDTQLLRLLHDLRHNLSTLLIKEGSPNFHAIINFEESVGHTPTDDDFVHLVQHVHDELDLVTHLGTTEDSQDGLHRRIQYLRKCIQLLGHQCAGTLDVKAFTNHGAVCTMRGAKSIVTINICHLANGCAKFFHFPCLRFDLVAICINTLTFFLDIEAQVLQQDYCAHCWVGSGSFCLRTKHRGAECNRHTKLLLHDLRHWCHGVLLNNTAIWTAQV